MWYCKRLYKHSRARYGTDEGTLQVGYCRQEGGKYYQDGELLFDLGLQVGDTFMPRRGMPLIVKAVGETTLTDMSPYAYELLLRFHQTLNTINDINIVVQGML